MTSLITRKTILLYMYLVLEYGCCTPGIRAAGSVEYFTDWYMAENCILCCQCSPFLSVNHFAFSCYMEIINQIEDDLSALIFVIKEYTFEVLKNC